MVIQENIIICWGSSDAISIAEKECFHSFTSLDELNAQKDLYCYTTTQSVLPSALVKLGEAAIGTYLWIEFQSSSSLFFGMVLNTHWLQKQLQLPSLVLTAAVEKVLKRWQNQTTGQVDRRHIFYLKSYRERSYRALLTQTYFYELLYRLVVEAEMEIQSEAAGTFRNTDHQKIRETVEQVLQTIHLPTPSIESMATSAGMSSSKFKIIFKEIYGTGPHQYLLDQKLAYAHSLLKSGKYTLTQIAYKIGYNHTSGFTRIYKKKYP